MIDESKRKKLIYASIAFGVIIIVSIVGFLVFNNKEDLPPTEDSTETSESTNKEDSTTPEEPSVFKNGIEFKQFEALSRATITDMRIDVVRYYLAEYAATQSTGVITSYTLDEESIKPTEDGDRQIYTFTVKDNNKIPYKVELSYIYAADAFVQVFDKDGTLIQSSPAEIHDE